MDLTALVSKKPSTKDTCIVKDMITNQTPATRALLTHPVVETYLDLKWLNVRYYFIGNRYHF